jgi:DNA-binding transcriptional regulator YhcF (GntR family)
VKSVLSSRSRESAAAARLPPLSTIGVANAPSTLARDAIYSLLRKTAVENRTGKFQRFYSMRSVANYFHVPTTTVSRIFHRLCDEKLLRIVWGSETLLEPSRYGRALNSRSIVVPVALQCFLTLESYRDIILEMQRDIWECGCVACLLFLEDENTQFLHFCKRWGLTRIDTIIWPSPLAGDRNTILRLRDIGIRITCIPRSPVRTNVHQTTVSTRAVRRIIHRQVLGLLARKNGAME